jgi:hypothetical protein
MHRLLRRCTAIIERQVLGFLSKMQAAMPIDQLQPPISNSGGESVVLSATAAVHMHERKGYHPALHTPALLQGWAAAPTGRRRRRCPGATAAADAEAPRRCRFLLPVTRPAAAAAYPPAVRPAPSQTLRPLHGGTPTAMTTL